MDLLDDDVFGLSVPFGGCAWVRDDDGADLSPEGCTESVAFFLSLAGAETGVEGRGECPADFCCDSKLARSILPHPEPPFLTLVNIFAGAQRCSRFLRLA